jgi:hypothetical protein
MLEQEYTVQDGQNLNQLKHLIRKAVMFVREEMTKNYPNSHEAKEVRQELQILYEDLHYRGILTSPKLPSEEKKLLTFPNAIPSTLIASTIFLKNKETKEIYAVWLDKAGYVLEADGPYDITMFLTPAFVERWKFEPVIGLADEINLHRYRYEEIRAEEG